MVAYSFKARFVEPIRAGLSLQTDAHVLPKRQTIRAERKRHARPGEELQLYRGMRTPQCFLIGRASCSDVRRIALHFPSDNPRRRGGLEYVAIEGRDRIVRARELDAFSRLDGFLDWGAMRAFWREEHDEIRHFRGAIILWVPQ